MLADLGITVLVLFGAYVAFAIAACLAALLALAPDALDAALERVVRVVSPRTSRETIDRWCLGLWATASVCLVAVVTLALLSVFIA